MKARVTVTLKTGILDPQGKAIEGALKSLGVAGVASVRQGKVFDIEIADGDRADAEARLRDAAEKLLANMPHLVPLAFGEFLDVSYETIADARAKPMPATLVQKISGAKTAGFQGVTGEISLDANRNASKPGLIVTVRQGKFEIAEKIAP